MRIRRATETDWPRLWPVWREIVAAGDTYTYDPASTSDQARATWLSGPPGETWVAEETGPGKDGPGKDGPGKDGDGPVLGAYRIVPNQPGAGSHVVNGSYMVAADHRGRGVGRVLVEHSIARCRELGYRGMQFNAVAATNTAAIGLYRRLGFATIGVVPSGFRHPREGFVDLHVMYRPL